MLKPTETSKEPKVFQKKLQKCQTFFDKIAELWIFPEFSLKIFKFDIIYPIVSSEAGQMRSDYQSESS